MGVPSKRPAPCAVGGPLGIRPEKPRAAAAAWLTGRSACQ